MISWDHFHWQRKKRKIDLTTTEQPCAFIEAWNYLVLTKVILLRFKVKTKNWVYSVFLWKKCSPIVTFITKIFSHSNPSLVGTPPFLIGRYESFQKLKDWRLGGGQFKIVGHSASWLSEYLPKKFFQILFSWIWWLVTIFCLLCSFPGLTFYLPMFPPYKNHPNNLRRENAGINTCGRVLFLMIWNLTKTKLLHSPFFSILPL